MTMTSLPDFSARRLAAPALLAASLLVPAGFGVAEKQSKPVQARKMKFTARAYAVQGVTASGENTKAGRTIAADPDVIPLGSRILVSGAGKYSGQYVVADTGWHVKGRRLDIFMTSYREAKHFGVKPVTVRVLSRGGPQ